MVRYYFDLQDGDFVPDPEGAELADIDAARHEAALSLAELAKDVLPGSKRRELIVSVHEESGPILFTAKLIYEMTEPQQSA